MRTTAEPPDPIEWTEYTDLRSPHRTVILGRIGGTTYGASYVSNRDKACEAIRSAARAQGKL